MPEVPVPEPPSTAPKEEVPRLVAMPSSIRQQQQIMRFDSDSYEIGIDNRASRCISHRKEDFVGVLHPTNRKIDGFASSTTGNLLIGTLKWTFDDDHGRPTTFLLPRSIYAAEGDVRLLSPQHWAQERRKTFEKQHHGTYEATFDDEIQLVWDSGTRRRTIPLTESGANVGTIHSAAGYEHFLACAAKIELSSVYCMPAEISDDEGELPASQVPEEELEGHAYTVTEDDGPTPTLTFELDGPEGPQVIPDEEDQYTIGDTSAEYLMWHHRLGHPPKGAIRELAKAGILPKRLATCSIPHCTSCLYGKATKRRWRNKPSKKEGDQPTETVTQPGACVSVDQMISGNPGLIAQLRGIPTKKRYTCATVFVDQATGYGYTHIQKSTNAEETIAAKEAFEAHARTMGIEVKHYHADNGIFADNKFRAACKTAGQELTFCGVNAHFQNGVAERRIRSLSEMARTMLVHAK